MQGLKPHSFLATKKLEAVGEVEGTVLGSMPLPHIPPWSSAPEVTEHRSVQSPHGLEEGERHIGG